MSDSIIKIDPNASQQKIIDDLNTNFFTLTQRIKQNNINISFLDLLRLDRVWSSTDEDDQTQRLQKFVSTVWNTLANYSGVFIQYQSNATDPEAAFILHGTPVFNGDYLIKLPGSEFIHIDGHNANYYVPSTSYSYGDGSITYTLTSDGPETQEVSIPTAAQSGYQVTEYAVYVGDDIPITPTSILSIRWFTWDRSEEVFWSGSYKDVHNQTTQQLRAIVCYTS